MMRFRRTLHPLSATTVLVALVITLVGGSSAAADAEQGDSTPGRARRVLVLSVPTLTFDDLRVDDLPNLNRIFARGGMADLSTRTVSRTNKPADGYGTLNAGTRTRGTEPASLAFIAGVPRIGSTSGTDGDPLNVPQGAYEEATADPETDSDVITGTPGATVTDPADDSTLPPEAGEKYRGSGTPAAEEFARRTGVIPPMGSVFNFGLVSMVTVNDRLLYDAEIGALGDALKDAGIHRAVIANGDHGPGIDDLDFRREAAVSLMDSDGLVERGRVGRSLLLEDPSAPFGARYDVDEVVAAFERFYVDDSVVLVEASDMIRSEAAKPLSLPTRQSAQRREALARSDEMLGRLLESVDLDLDAVIVLSPYASGYGSGLTAFAISAPGVEPGLAVSGTTRRNGFIQTVDIAPTIISLVGAETPTSMEGTIVESVPDGRSVADRMKALDQAFDAALFRDRMVGPASTFFVLIQIVLWAGAVWAMAGERLRARRVVQVAALAVLGFLPATYLAGLLPFYRWGSTPYSLFILLVSVVLAAVCSKAFGRGLVEPLMAMLGFIVAFLSIDIITGGLLQFNTVFGYTPTIAGRFDGMGNPAYSMFTAAGIILAALIAYRFPGSRGRWAAIALLGWLVLVDGLPIWGADVGGALSLIPTVGMMSLILLEVKIRFRTVLWLVLGAVVAVTALAFVDLARPETSRTHLGRLLSNTMDNGFGAFETVILRKLNANLSVLTSSIWTLMLPVVFAFIALIFWRAPSRMRTISDEIPQERAAVVGLGMALVLGFALNDSGIAIPGMMLGVISASLVHLMVRAMAYKDDDPADGGEPSGTAVPEGGREAMSSDVRGATAG